MTSPAEPAPVHIEMTTNPGENTAQIICAHPAPGRDPNMADVLVARLDLYATSILLTTMENGVPLNTRPVSPHDLASAITANTRTHTGILPNSTLWRSITPTGPCYTAIWVPPQVRRVALVIQYNEPTQRFTIPMPGMIFLCSPGQAPTIYACPSRPTSEHDSLYHCPVFNTFTNGTTCQGTHRYPDDVSETPDSFFKSWFTMHGDSHQLSREYPHHLLDRWKSLEGKTEYPNDDLIFMCKLQEAMNT